MALAKYAEEIFDKINENMAKREQTLQTSYISRVNTSKTTAAQPTQKERDDAFRVMFASESCFF